MTVYKLIRIAKDQKESTVYLTDQELDLVYDALNEFYHIEDDERAGEIMSKINELSFA
jgi:hypothetical protein